MKPTNHPLRAWRTSQSPKKTLVSLAGDLGVSPSHLSEIENWNNEPSLELSVRLRELTGIDPEQFIKRREAVQ